jgi:hypothetical protein
MKVNAVGLNAVRLDDVKLNDVSPSEGQRRAVKRGARRGFVLVMVLLVLLVLTLVGAALLDASGDSASVSTTMMGQRIAASRSDFAAQQAIAAVKLNQVAWNTLAPCSGPANGYLRDGGCGGSQIISSGRISGTGADLAGGLGLRYQWWVYRPTPPAGVAYNAQLVAVYAEGYYGQSEAAGNFTVSAVEAEVMVPLPIGGNLESEFDYGILR